MNARRAQLSQFGAPGTVTAVGLRTRYMQREVRMLPNEAIVSKPTCVRPSVVGQSAYLGPVGLTGWWPSRQHALLGLVTG